MRNRVQLVLLIAVLLLVHPASSNLPGPLDGFGTPSAAAAVQLRTIVFPVAAPAIYGDTFGACRDGCSRSHQGVDIFAPKLTPVIAAADGRITSERRNATRKAGNKLVIEDAEGWRYIYLHLNNDTPGTDDDANPQSWIAAADLRAGDTVRAGQVIGYLGDSGNAEETPPHLHFEIVPPGQSSINPTPSVTAARGRGDIVAAAELELSAEIRADWEPIVDDAYRDLAGRPPTDDERAAWTNRLALGLGTETDLIADLAMAAPFREPEGVAIRSYVVTFSRLPSENELAALAGAYRGGATSTDLAERIVSSTDYSELKVFSPGAGLGADEIAAIAQSADIKEETWHLVQIVRAYRAAAGRLPTAEEIDSWTNYLQRGGLMVDVVAGALEGTMPIGEPRNAGMFGPSDLGYVPGENVRQGPVDLDPETDPGDGGRGIRTPGETEFDVALSVDEDDDGTDVANLTVRIPIDELAANADGDVELTIELQLTPGEDGGDPTADFDLVVVEPARSADDANATDALIAADTTADDDDPGPLVSTPTTRRPIPRAPSGPAAPTAPPRPTTTPPTTSPRASATTGVTSATTSAPAAPSGPDTPVTPDTSGDDTTTTTVATTTTVTVTAGDDTAGDDTAGDQPPTTCSPDSATPTTTGAAAVDGSTATPAGCSAPATETTSPSNAPTTDGGGDGDESATTTDASTSTTESTDDGTGSTTEGTDETAPEAAACDAPADANTTTTTEAASSPDSTTQPAPCPDGGGAANELAVGVGGDPSSAPVGVALRAPAVQRTTGLRRRLALPSPRS
jgi:hypothetical protein